MSCVPRSVEGHAKDFSRTTLVEGQQRIAIERNLPHDTNPSIASHA